MVTPGDSVICTVACVLCTLYHTIMLHHVHEEPNRGLHHLHSVLEACNEHVVFRAATSYCVYNSSQDLNRTTPASSETTIQRRMRYTSCVSCQTTKLILSHCLDIAVIHRLLCLCQPRLHDLPPDAFGRHSSRSTPSVRRYCEQTSAGRRRRGRR